MKLYDFKGNGIENVPKKVFRGLDPNKYKPEGICQVENILKEGRVPSHALLIDEGKFDFERMWKHASPGQFGDQTKQKYVEMIQQNSLNPEDIDGDLRYHHWIYLPTPLVSVSSSIVKAARYSGWVVNPILVYKTDNLEGIDFRGEPQDTCSEIGIFKELPTKNLTDIIYFYEKPKQLKELLKDFGREDIKLHKGFIKPEFRYITCSGEKHFNITCDLSYDSDFQEFYKNKELALLGA